MLTVEIPTVGLASFIAELAKRHGVSYAPTGLNSLADTITRLAGDEVEPDETEELVIAVRQTHVIDGKTMLTLLDRHFAEVRHARSVR